MSPSQLTEDLKVVASTKEQRQRIRAHEMLEKKEQLMEMMEDRERRRLNNMMVRRGEEGRQGRTEATEVLVVGPAHTFINAFPIMYISSAPATWWLQQQNYIQEDALDMQFLVIIFS